VLTRILQEAGKANKTVYAFFLDVRKAYDTVWRDIRQKGVDGKLWRVLRDLAEPLTSQGERGPSEAFPECGRPRGPPSTLLFDIFIDDLVA
jgi:hypothetical protein